jgi:DNA integrity scanning protein DisA with diadenylate cyclase activity
MILIGTIVWGVSLTMDLGRTLKATGKLPGMTTIKTVVSMEDMMMKEPIIGTKILVALMEILTLERVGPMTESATRSRILLATTQISPMSKKIGTGMKMKTRKDTRIQVQKEATMMTTKGNKDTTMSMKDLVATMSMKDLVDLNMITMKGMRAAEMIDTMLRGETMTMIGNMIGNMTGTTIARDHGMSETTTETMIETTIDLLEMITTIMRSRDHLVMSLAETNLPKMANMLVATGASVDSNETM